MHYVAQWHVEPAVHRWMRGPINALPDGFCILVFPPGKRRFWTYATCCMSQPLESDNLELHLFSPYETDAHLELLATVAHYHRTGARLGVRHTVNFGRPWLPGSHCDRGLISLPYLDGPNLENSLIGGDHVRFLWLLPVTGGEVEFAKTHGLDALERRFESAPLNYLDPKRESVA